MADVLGTAYTSNVQVLSTPETTSKALAFARTYGLQPVPLDRCVLGPERSGKRPVHDGWLDRDYQDSEFRDGNVGIKTGTMLPGGGFLLVVDVDQKQGKTGNEQWLDLCTDEGIDLPTSLQVLSGSGNGSHHLYLRTTEPFRDIKLLALPDVEFKGLGGQVVAAGCPHHLGGTYTAVDAEIAWAPIELENVLRTQVASGKGRIQTDEQVFAQDEVHLDEATLSAFVAEFPYHHMSDVFRRMLKGEAFSSPGHRHQDIRLGLLPQILAVLGANVAFDSLAWAFRGDYPEGFDRDTSGRMYDALRTAARKVDPQERRDMDSAAGLVRIATERTKAVATAVRAEVAEALEAGQDPDPEDARVAGLLAGPLGLEVNTKGRIKNDQVNVVKILRAFFLTRLRMNLRTGNFEVRNLPWAPSDWRPFDEKPDATAFMDYFHTRWGISVSLTVLEAILAVAEENKFDPVVEYLKEVSWDGTERALELFVRAVGASDSDHTRAVTRCFLVGAVARAMRPGCKLDTQLILSGPQGARKSTFFESLCRDREWFSDTGRTEGEAEKDFLARLHTLWIWEDSELATGVRDEAAKKAFLSRKSDTFRPPYARLNVTRQRRFVCAGSTNETEVLYDPTGSRRYHILTISGLIDIDYVSSVRDQIWAEAVHMYEAGAQWWLSTAEQETANQVNTAHKAETPAEVAADKIEEWFSRRRSLSAVDTGGEMYGTLSVHPEQFSVDGTMWCASSVQIGEALRLSPALVGKAITILCSSRGWEKMDKVRILGKRLRTSVCVPNHAEIREVRRSYLVAKNPRLAD